MVRLIAGHRRLEACKALGWSKIPVTVVDIKDVTRGQADENAVRKDLTPSEAVAIARMLEPEVKREATERHGVQVEKKPELTDGGKLPLSGAEKTRDKLGKFVGMSGRTLEKATQVVVAAQQDPEKYGRLLKKMDEKGKVDGAFRELRRIQNSAVGEGESASGDYDVVLAVPPWMNTGDSKDAQDRSERLEAMTPKEMKNLKLPLAEDAVLFVQALAERLAPAMDLMMPWGFKYRTFLVWEHGGYGSSPWSLENHHVLLLGVRGNHQPPSPDNRPPFVIKSVGAEASTESTIVYQRIKEMFPRSKYLEVFVQSNHEGWTPWLAG